jgi:polar amino acid transport system substrate-binding protein
MHIAFPSLLAHGFQLKLCLVLLLSLLGSLFSGLAASQNLDSATQARLAKNPVVRIGVIADNEPYSAVRSGRVEGFSIDVLEEVSRQTGLRFDYKAGSWPEIYPAFQRGELDAIDEISWREERTAFTLFSEPYHHRQTVVMHDASRPLPAIKQLEELKPYRVGLVSDIYYKSAFTRRGIAVTEYDGLPNLLRALAFGWVDAIVGPEVTLAYLAREQGLSQLALTGRVPMDGFEVEDFRIGVHISQPEIHRIITNGLAAIPAQRFQELQAQWQEFGGKRSAQAGHFKLGREEADYVRRLGSIRVGIMDDYAPFSFVDSGKSQGLAIDVLARIQDMTGLSVQNVSGRWPVLLEMFQRGEIDVLANMSKTEERMAFARFTDAYHVIPNVAFTLRTDLRLEKLDDLRGLRIALGRGIYYEAALRAQFGDAVIAYSAQDAMFKALAEGSVDVVLASLQNGNHWVRTLQLSHARIAGDLNLLDIQGEDLRFGVRPALEPLAGLMNKALLAISPMEKGSIENRWLGAVKQRQVAIQQSLSEAEKRWLDERGPIVVCVDPDWMPLEALDDQNRHQGLAADFLAHMREQIGITTTILPVRTWQASLDAAQARRCDMLALAMATPQREVYMDFTTPYYTTPNVLLGRIEAPFLNNMNDFSGKRVGIVRGFAYAELLRSSHPRLELVEFDNEREGLASLQGGEIDGYIGAMATLNYQLRELGYADLKVIARAPGDWMLSLATRNDQPELLSIAQKMVDSIREDERGIIENRWQSPQFSERLNTRLIWQIVIGASLALLILLLWNRKLGNLNRQLAEANAKLAQLSQTDALTGLRNRSYFDLEYPRIFRWCQRSELRFAVAMIDIDHFKRINDQYGHAAGDVCLRELADCLRACLRRETDHLARIGGEEFVAFMPDTQDIELSTRFEQLRQEIEALRVAVDGKIIRFTVSIGLQCAEISPHDTPEAWLKASDKALYEAKNLGRNRIEKTSATVKAI